MSMLLAALAACALLAAVGAPAAAAAPLLTSAGLTITDPPPGGDGDGILEPGETASVTSRLQNTGADAVSGATGTLSSTTAGVTVPQPAATWSSLGAGAFGSGAPAFRVGLGSAVSCNAAVDLSLAVSSDQGAATVPIRMTGGPTTASADPGLPHDISSSAGFDSTVELTGPGTMSNLRVSIPKLIHNYMSDVAMTLRSPAGTTVTLMSYNGGSGDDLANVVFADDADTSISSLPGSSPPGGYTGTYRPVGKLSSFDGESRAGTWTLHVWDTYPSADSGKLYSWGLGPTGVCSTSGNDAPVAGADSYSVPSGATFAGASVLANDSDVDGDPLTAVKVSDPAHGTLVLNANGTFTYSPAAGYFGSDSFSYRASDGTLTSPPRAVSITVKAPNVAPTAAPNSYSTRGGATLSAGSVLGNDYDANGDALTAVKASDPAHGTLTLNANGTFTYVSEPDFAGADTFTYRASDGTLQSDPATVTITVAGNAAPVAAGESISLPFKGYYSSTVALLANDSDPDGDPLTIVKDSDPAHGTLYLYYGGQFSYQPEYSYSGPDSFTYHLTDGGRSSQIVTVAITVRPNAAPVAVPDSYTMRVDGTLEPCCPLTNNDTDENGDSITAVKASDPAHGTLTLYGYGGFTYKPAAGFMGTDSFAYRATDGALQSAPATVTITVKPNTPPVAVDDSFTTRTGKLVALPVGNNDTDGENDGLHVVSASDPPHGTAAVFSGTLWYYPDDGYTGPDSFTYVAGDGLSPSEPATVSVTVTPNHPPVAPDMSVSTPSNQRFGSSVTYYASDADGDALSPVVDDQPQHGSMTMNGYGSFSYKAEKSYSGPDSFTYHLNDGYEDSAQATVHITVLASFNRAPRADPTEYWFNPGKTGTIQVWWHAGDPDEDPIGAEVVTQPAVGRLWVDGGTLRYTPPANYLGTTTATYRVSDGELWSPPATVTLNVIPPIIWPADPAASSTSKSKVKAGGAIQPFANLFVDHAAIRGRRLTLRAGISRLATGTVKVSFSAAGATTRGTARIVKGAIAVSLPLAGRQRHSRTGVVTLTYGGNSAVRPERVRVAAAPAASRLRVTQARIAASGRLALAGSISRRAHGVLQVRLTYSPRAGKTKEYDYKARIRGGGWSLGDVLPAEAAKTRVQVTVMYAGDGARGIGGAHISQEVGP